jgi:aspartyl/asparaginyl beta-hydroxylase (cupin superfamily)
MDAAMSELLAQEGLAALRRGDGAAACDYFVRYSEIVGDANTPWLMLAQAHHLTGDLAAEQAALAKLLSVETRNLPALLMMGHAKARGGDDRAASSYYQTALNVAAITPDIPATLHPMLKQAQDYMASANDRYQAHLVDALKGAGVQPTGRVGAALDLLLGRTQLYVQQPTSFYFPGLPQRQYYERHEFDWLAKVEVAVPDMQTELAAILNSDDGFAPYVESSPDRPLPANPLRDDPSWGALYFWKGGERILANADRAPATMKALSLAPQPFIDKRSPMALYSRLTPGTHIQPHHGLLNTRLICHIPLIAPPGCALRVGNETREWRMGETLIFDDSFEHEAWNRGTADRIVLLFEIWRPEISVEEQAALTVMFEAINAYAGAPLDQG